MLSAEHHGGIPKGGRSARARYDTPVAPQNEKVAFVSALAGRSPSQFARVNRGSGRAGFKQFTGANCKSMYGAVTFTIGPRKYFYNLPP